MEKETFDPFATVLKYIPNESDISLEDAINCALKYEEEKEKKNKEFLEYILKTSNENEEIKKRLLYILNNVDIACEEDEEAYLLTLESTLNGLEIYITFKLKKESINPTIECVSELNELEAIIARLFTNSNCYDKFINICKTNLVYDDKEYTIKVNNCPVELNLSCDRISLNSTTDSEDLIKNIFVIYPYSKDIYVDDSLPREGFIHVMRNNLSFFTKACFVKKSDIPEELLNFGFNCGTSLERIIETSDIGDDRERIETYYIALPNEIRELEDVEEINEAEDNMYNCIFEDGSELEISRDRLFTITKSTKKFTLAEKALGLKEK